MSRDPKKLKVFEMADGLVLDVYRCTRRLPPDERYGLQSQIRRSAVSVAANIVEGCARRTTRDYLRFLTQSLGSAYEVRYLIGLAGRLELLPSAESDAIVSRYDGFARALQALLTKLEEARQSLEPKA